MGKRGKTYQQAAAKIDRSQRYGFEEAMTIIKDTSKLSFDGTVDIAVRLGVNPRNADQMVRGAVVLPHGTGKSVRVAVFAKGDKAKEAQEAGADFVGDDDLVEKIKGGWLGFDKCIATPPMMATVGKIGRVLGPRGLMPNPKSGSVTFDVGQAVAEAKAGKVDFRVEKAGIIHAGIGRLSFTAEQLSANAQTLIDQLVKMKPSTAKGTYVRSISVSATMSPGIWINPNVAAE